VHPRETRQKRPRLGRSGFFVLVPAAFLLAATVLAQARDLALRRIDDQEAVIGVEQGNVAVGRPAEEALNSHDRWDAEELQECTRPRAARTLGERHAYRVRARGNE